MSASSNPITKPVGINENQRTKISETNFDAMKAAYTTSTLIILDWLKKSAPTLDPSSSNDDDDKPLNEMSEREMLDLAEAIGQANKSVPENILSAWQESIGMRERMVGFQKAQREVWDSIAKERILLHEEYVRTLRLARIKALGGFRKAGEWGNLRQFV